MSEVTQDTTGYCPSCGTSVGEADRFCRACGQGLDPHAASSIPLADGIATDSDGSAQRAPARRSRRWAAVAAVTIVALVAAGVALIATGTFQTAKAGPTKAQVVAQRLERTRARLLPQLRDAASQRTAFFVSERTFLSAMADSRGKVHRYLRQVAANAAESKRITEINQPAMDACTTQPVPCPDPTYPTDPPAPDVSGDVHRLRNASSRLNVLHAQVLNVTPQPELKVMYTQFQAAIEALVSDVTANADTLTKAVTPPDANQETSGGVDASQINTLRDESAIPAIRQMNNALVREIHQLKLAIAEYDVPGGSDADPSDHSTLA
jgi:hypothetical protein